VRFLLDANVLIALVDTDHTAHDRATAWFQRTGGKFATCPITQGALIRYMLRVQIAPSISEAKEFLARVVSLEGHEFWPDSVPLLELPEKGIRGYGQVTDAYLVLLARSEGGTMATLDRALAAIHGDAVVFIP
jgi:hypothetical protein